MNYFFRTKIVLVLALMQGISHAYAEAALPTAPPPLTNQAPQTVITQGGQQVVVRPAAPNVVVRQAPAQTTVSTTAAPIPPPPVSPSTSQPPQVVSNVLAPAQPQIAPQIPSTAPTSPQAAQSEFDTWLRQHGYAASNTQKPVPTTAMRKDPTNRPPNLRPPSRRVIMRRRPLTYEESQQVMLDSAPAPTFPVSEDAAIAFNTLLQQNMPLSPQQIVQLRQQIDKSQRAAAIPPTIPPKPVSSTIMINLAPGTTPPAVRLAQGYVTSLVFVDSTGAPWPIGSFDIGNPKAVNIQWDGKSNILLLQAVLPYSDGDIVIRLVGLPTPVTLELVAGQRVVDYRVDIHVSGIGPLTKEIPIGTALPNSANQLLLSVLDGVAPPGSRGLVVIGSADSQAWVLGERLYLRTRFTVLSPGWIGTMVSPDGMHAYELPRTSSVLISRYGEPVELRIEGL